jgi:hypothetical protein
LLNTYYCDMPTLRTPEAIFLYYTPIIRTIARIVSGHGRLRGCGRVRRLAAKAKQLGRRVLAQIATIVIM